MTHEGLHSLEVLFFGEASAKDIFQRKIKSALTGLKGCTSIHDNILVWGKDAKEHEENLDACLTRIQEIGLTLHREKCNFGKPVSNGLTMSSRKRAYKQIPAKLNPSKQLVGN